MIIILSIAVAILIGLSIYLMSRLDSALTVKDGVEFENDKLIAFIEALDTRLLQTYLKMKMVDKRGSFSTDDEVGFAFQEILQALKDLHIFINELTITQQDILDAEKEEEEV